VTPTASVDADQLNVRPVWETDVTASPLGALGGVVSPQADVVTLIVEIAERFPAASAASAPSWYEVPQVRPVTVYAVAVVVPMLVPLR
jgi:hypothetical protein